MLEVKNYFQRISIILWVYCIKLGFLVNFMDLNLAVLIDGDNIPSAYMKEMMEETMASKNLTPLIKSIKKFKIEQRESPKGRFKLIYVKNNH